MIKVFIGHWRIWRVFKNLFITSNSPHCFCSKKSDLFLKKHNTCFLCTSTCVRAYSDINSSIYAVQWKMYENGMLKQKYDLSCTWQTPSFWTNGFFWQGRKANGSVLAFVGQVLTRNRATVLIANSILVVSSNQVVVGKLFSRPYKSWDLASLKWPMDFYPDPFVSKMVARNLCFWQSSILKCLGTALRQLTNTAMCSTIFGTPKSPKACCKQSNCAALAPERHNSDLKGPKQITVIQSSWAW